jgi:carboxymethylenebutenolidase
VAHHPGMDHIQRYLVEEVVEDYADGLIERREALRRLGLLGLASVAAGGLLAACDAEGPPPSTPTSAGPTGAPAPPAGPSAVPTQAVTFPGEGRILQGAFAAAPSPRGSVLVIHENRGLTDHIRSVAGRLAASGYAALAIDLLSAEGGTAALGDQARAMAALSAAPRERHISDMKAGVTELLRRGPSLKVGAVGFCFGGMMVWTLLSSGESRLAAAAPFYGPFPEGGDVSGSKNAAVLAVYAGEDARVNASRAAAEEALRNGGLTYEVAEYPGVDHAFFNDTGQRYNAEAAAQVYQRLTAWFDQHLAPS